METREKPLSREGIELTPGMKVAHQDDEWADAGEVVMVDRIDSVTGDFYWDVLYRRKGARATSDAKRLYASEEGLRLGKIEEARKYIAGLEREIQAYEAIIARYEAVKPETE